MLLSRFYFLVLMILSMILSDCTKYKSSFGDGTWVIGKDISPGTYRSQGGKSCYWERLSGFGGNNILTNGFGDTRPVVTISPKDKGFKTENCGTWIEISKDSSKTKNDGSVQSKTAILPDSLEHAKTLLIGTWTYTEPLTGLRQHWIKYVFMPDGNCQYFKAMPVESNWGKGKSCRWVMKTSKYSDTGERFWYAQFVSGADNNFYYHFVLIDSLHASAMSLAVPDPSFIIPFVKADVFPFSR
jgi:hypothetical protein